MLVSLLFLGLCTTDSFVTEVSSPNARPAAGSKVAAENPLLYKRSCDVSLQALQNLCLFLSCPLSAVGLSVLFNGPRSTVCAGCTGPFYLPPSHCWSLLVEIWCMKARIPSPRRLLRRPPRACQCLRHGGGQPPCVARHVRLTARCFSPTAIIFSIRCGPFELGAMLMAIVTPCPSGPYCGLFPKLKP